MKKTDYEILHQIGRGSYASVHKAINKQTGQICAIKKIPVTSELTSLINEIQIMSDCECKNIVKFLDSACHDREVSIVMEYCCGGSVKDVMRHLGRTMTQDQVKVILKDVLNGLDYLHSKDKIHRDVKAANILLNEEGIAKLGDFGVSEPRAISASERSIIGTPLWLPPEVLNRDEEYTTVIDIWSLGVTIIEMADGQPPYSDLEQSEALRQIRDREKPAPTFRDPASFPGLIDFLNLCLVKDASRRKRARELLDHDIIRNAPGNGIIKDLVLEASSQTNLYQKAKCSLKETIILFDIYQERRMAVIRVDQMRESLNSVKKDYKEMEDRLALMDSKVQESRLESKRLKSECERLMREKNELQATLESQKAFKEKILDELGKIKRFETNETQRRMKLRSLANNNG